MQLDNKERTLPMTGRFFAAEYYFYYFTGYKCKGCFAAE